MSLLRRLALAVAALSVLLGGCALAAPERGAGARVGLDATMALPVVSRDIPALRCDLDSLWWSHGFVARTDAGQCVAILGVVELGN